MTQQDIRDEEVQWSLHQQRELRDYTVRKGLWIDQATEDLLNRALFKAEPKRFTGAGPSNFAPLIEVSP